jgi:prolipoprotein diacylglyceryltransferase
MHPTQIYHIIWNLAAFGVLWSLRRKLKPTGSVFLLYLAFYAAGDLIIRFFREGEPFLFGLQQAQLIGIIMLVITVPWLVVRIWLAKRKTKAR